MKKEKKKQGEAIPVRLNKVLADSGLCSRRQADQKIQDGEVQVNGKKVFELGIRVHPERDRIVVGGKPLRPILTQDRHRKIYVLFHKPKGVLTTMEDPLGRTTIKDYFPKLRTRVFPVGRLDGDSDGLLILTNDGDYAHRVMHPKGEIPKTYLVKINGKPSEEQLNKLLSGVSIIGGKVSAKSIRRLSMGSSQYAWVRIVITEGKNRQIRQMFEKIGFDVMKLHRTAIGGLRLGRLKRGDCIFLDEREAHQVFRQVGPKNGES